MTKIEFSKSIAIALTFAMAAVPKRQIGSLVLRLIEAGSLTNKYATDENPCDDRKSRVIKFSFVGSLQEYRNFDRHMTIEVSLEELGDVGSWRVTRVARVGDVTGQRVVSARRLLNLRKGVHHPLVLGLFEEEGEFAE